ncbi:hypothetical protein CHARACLAT_032401 [Characodon lateralis]|uniref:Uncharacterized protein n=1 Tax=Characodon lateralis TaxID=208331 RepID=A0ABU7CV52_9TELE|nr:hypothetical protein [Characodon lateralis]
MPGVRASTISGSMETTVIVPSRAIPSGAEADVLMLAAKTHKCPCTSSCCLITEIHLLAAILTCSKEKKVCRDILLERSVVGEHVLPADVKEEAPEEQSPDVDQQEPEPLQIKEEQEELWTSQEGEQLTVKEETDTRFPLTAAPIKRRQGKGDPLVQMGRSSLDTQWILGSSGRLCA